MRHLVIAITLSILMVHIASVKSLGTEDPGDAKPTTPAPLVDPSLVAHYNSRIRQALRDNPTKDSSGLALAATFNERRILLMNALIGETPQLDDDQNAAEALESFRDFLREYNVVEDQLESAIADLAEYEDDPQLPVEIKYEASKLQSQLQNSRTIKDARNALKRYERFIKTPIKPTADVGGISPSPSFPHLDKESQQQFDEILRILRKYDMENDPEMQDILQQLLEDPKKLRKLADALKDLSEEDYDYFETFLDLFSF